jgi:[acyl-carrier-protein] S-malonyltransferase
MKPAEEKMAHVLGDIPFQKAQWSIIQNFTAEPTVDATALKENLTKQISGTVRWTESVQKALALGVRQGIELGHGQVIRGLNKKISGDLEMFSVQSLEDLKNFEKQFKG